MEEEVDEHNGEGGGCGGRRRKWMRTMVRV